jgi:hypothetical protein
MDRKSELKNEISNIWEIFINANECFHYSFYLHKPDTQEEFDYLNSSNDLKYIRHIMWRMSIIELSKLFSGPKTRDRFNIQHLISKLKKDGNLGNIGISDETLNNWEAEIKKNQKSVNSILTLRDKIYAHTDSHKTEYLSTTLSFEDIGYLLKIVEVIIQDIHSSVFETYADVETIVFNRKRFNIVKILAEERKVKIEILENEYKRQQ